MNECLTKTRRGGICRLVRTLALALAQALVLTMPVGSGLTLHGLALAGQAGGDGTAAAKVEPAPQQARPARGEAAAKEARPTPPPPPPATMANVAYGTHPRQVFDFWKADSASPTPLVFVIHGGGWRGGDKEKGVTGLGVSRLLKQGISVVSINYRYTTQAAADGVTPPVKAPLHDAARALQFVRSKAGEWNIDKTRIGATGGSAGACSSLWLAFHDDLADPTSSDPVARESTRLLCAAVNGAQTTLDPVLMKEWIPNSTYGGHAFGIQGFDKFLAARESVKEWIAEYSPHAHVSAGDPPVYLVYNAAPALGEAQKDPTHSANFGVKLRELCQQHGVACDLVYPGAEGVKHPRAVEYLIEKLTAQPGPKPQPN